MAVKARRPSSWRTESALPGAQGDLQQAVIARPAQLEGIDLVVLVEAEAAAGERGVVGEADPIRRQEAADAEAEALVLLMGDPILVGVDLRTLRQRLPAHLTVEGPALQPVGGQEVGVQEEAAIGARPAEVEVQVRRAHVDPDVDGTEGAPEEAPEERLLLALPGLRRRPLAPARGRELVGERAPVRRQQAAADGGVMTGGAARVLLREEHRLGLDPGRGQREADACEDERHPPAHRDAPVACVVTDLATRDTFTSTSSLTPTPRYWGFAIP